MKKAVNYLFAGWVLGALALSPVSLPFISSANIVQAAPALAFVSGTVKDEGGAPLGGAVVALLEAQARGKELKSIKTDAQGRFTADVTPGSYRLRAVAEGFMPTFQRIYLDRGANFTYHFALKRTDTLVQKRGDRDDYRWIGRSVPRHVLNFEEDDAVPAQDAQIAVAGDNSTGNRLALHGTMQLLAVSSAARAGVPQSNFFGTNFALAGAFNNGLEFAVVGQRGTGTLAPQRISAIATLRPKANHQVTASIGYGQMALARRPGRDFDDNSAAALAGRAMAAGDGALPRSLDQFSVSAIDEWQVAQPLVIIYGFDYARFTTSAAAGRESLLPRVAVQYSPSARWRAHAALTPGASQMQDSPSDFSTENIHTEFQTQATETAFTDTPILDRSRRIETGVERIFNDGSSSLEASAFYDIVSGHGIGVLALPLEASPAMQAQMQQVAHQVAAMNGAARGLRMMYAQRFGEHVTFSGGYSFGHGSRFDQVDLNRLTPARLFRNSFFRVAAAKVDLDFSERTGTRVSTVVRLSPAAVVFAIDPFAGRMSVYDPNISIYATQELPNFGLPIQWEALLDVRNLLDQAQGVEEGMTQLIAVRTRRTVRGGLAFRW